MLEKLAKCSSFGYNLDPGVFLKNLPVIAQTENGHLILEGLSETLQVKIRLWEEKNNIEGTCDFRDPKNGRTLSTELSDFKINGQKVTFHPQNFTDFRTWTLK